MPEDIDRLALPHAHKKRRRGQRMNKKERQQVQQAFLDSFRLNANVTVACTQANMSRETFYQWCEHDQEFSIRYNQASEMANDVLLAAAWRRGVQGVEEPVVSMGSQVYEEIPILNADGTPKLDSKGKPTFKKGRPLMKRVYSDSVLLRLMSWRIAGFKEAGPGTTINNVNLQMQRNETYANLRDDELDQLENLWSSAQERLNRGGSS